MQEGEPVGICIGLQRRRVHQAAYGIVGHEQAPALLFHQLRRLAAGDRNAENVLVLRDSSVARRYARQWDRFWAESEGLEPGY